jgi:hypothetical protein
MIQAIDKRRLILGLASAAALLFSSFQSPARTESGGRTSVTVLVTDAETGQPIPQARLTFQFREPGSKVKLKLPRSLSYSAKTNLQGRYRFVDIPKGTVHVIATAERHQSLGKDYEVEEDNQVIEVKLKLPQPLL